jgi:subtilase family protein
VRSLQRIAALSFVRFIRLPSYARRHAGAVVTEGDAIHASNVAREQFGVDGTGVRVGVISDGIKGVFDTKCQSCRTSSGSPVASGDLPEAEGTRRNGVLVSSQGGIVSESFRSDEDLEDTHSFFQPCAFRGAGAEGTALLEIVHDLAPGAQLAFANADTSLAFNAAVNALAAENDVVVDDLGFLGEPADGQSSVSRNTAAALNNPQNRIRTYITSVGNAANDHYFGTYVDSGRDGRTINGIGANGRLHLFQRTNETTDVLGLGDQPYDLISLPNNGEVVVVLTWNDPAGQSANNYDLYLVDDDTGAVVAQSTDVQRGGQDALEAIDFLNRGESGLFRIVVQNVADQAAPRNLNMFAFQPQCAVDGPRRLATGRHERHNYNTATRSVLAQSDAGGSPVSVISVGAICSASQAAASVFAGSDAPSESCNESGHSTIQFFSSQGPTLDGRLKPDVAAIDGVAVTGAGRFPSPFFGTSAAAPHVAGIAALALQVAPCLRSGATGGLDTVTARTTLRDLIVTSADPIGSPVPNMTFGHGLANALRTMQRALAVCSGSDPGPPPPPPPPPPPSPDATIALNANVRFQTMHRWEGVAAGGPALWAGFTAQQIARAADLAINDLNFTRARLEIVNGAEGSSVSSNPARYTPVNDNNDPNVLNLSAFDFLFLDTAIDTIVRPLRQAAAAAGKTLYLDLRYVDFIANTPFEHWRNPAEYGEFMLAVFTHMRDKYGFVPDSINVINEPDNSADYAGQGDKIGRMIVAAATRLQAAGFRVPDFGAPSVTAMGNLPGLFDQIATVPNALQYLTEISYHRYNSSGDPNDIVSRALAHGKRTAMLEKWDADGNAALLYRDLTEVRASAWEQSQFIDGAPACQFNQMMFLNNGVVEYCPNTRLIRQYTRHVRPGAQRIEATSRNSALAPVAFINSDGGYVVVVKADGTGSFSVGGLPAGTYGIFYASASRFDVNLPDVTISAGQALSTSMPEVGVITIYRR